VSESKYRIFKYLDAPDKIFFLYTDELLVGLGTGLLVGFLVNGYLGVVLGFVAVRLRRQARKSKYGNLVNSVLYWNFPYSNKQSFRPDSSKREFIS
jgi:type IV conjugative transfer system protein TraL